MSAPISFVHAGPYVVATRQASAFDLKWRDALLPHLGSSLLPGTTLAGWLRLLRENRFAIAPSCWLRALMVSLQGIRNTYENWAHGATRKEAHIEPPIFILGHWRSGTTHLHRLLTLDRRFAFPNVYETLFPHTFLSTETVDSRLFDFLMPKWRPMDDMEWNIHSPAEDEFAVCVSTGKSPCMGWAFPERREHYDRYLTFRDVPQREIAEWRRAFLSFLSKLTLKYGRPLVLKSPTHTCRIKLLLEMFPQAKFVHIHRDPYKVFQSSQRTFRVNFQLAHLQKPRLDDLDDWIIAQYRKMYEAFFEERGLVPSGQFHEVRFEDLENDPMGQLRRIYAALGLPAFEACEPAVKRYIDSIAYYEKNSFAPLSDDLRDRIRSDWRPCFEEWDYPA